MIQALSFFLLTCYSVSIISCVIRTNHSQLFSKRHYTRTHSAQEQHDAPVEQHDAPTIKNLEKNGKTKTHFASELSEKVDSFKYALKNICVDEVLPSVPGVPDDLTTTTQTSQDSMPLAWIGHENEHAWKHERGISQKANLAKLSMLSV